MYGTASSKLDERVNTTSTTYLITGLEEFTEYFVQVHAETSVSGAASIIEQAKTHEDGKLFSMGEDSRIKRTAVPIGNLFKKNLRGSQILFCGRVLIFFFNPRRYPF